MFVSHIFMIHLCWCAVKTLDSFVSLLNAYANDVMYFKWDREVRNLSVQRPVIRSYIHELYIVIQYETVLATKRLRARN